VGPPRHFRRTPAPSQIWLVLFAVSMVQLKRTTDRHVGGRLKNKITIASANVLVEEQESEREQRMGSQEDFR
jgi:hypothetical protein